MKTKAFFLTTMMFVFLLICSTGIQAQTAKSSLDQVKLNKQKFGTWEATADKDTIWVREQQEYGKAYTVNVYYVVKGTKSPYYISNSSFDSKEGKFKGFTLYANGKYSTWIGLWTSEKKFSIDAVQDFKPGTVLAKVEYVYETPTSLIETRFSATGVKMLERKYIKVK
ncbi:MAG: hypothetical protein NTZ69_09335 [Bacteroidia bacterium]|nr:hypothetical protein [Bacteroidia bacterium]